MMPGAGLYLRETLHQRPSSKLDPTGAQSVRRRSFAQRAMAKTSQESNNNNSNTFSSLPTVSKFVGFVAKLGEVTAENRVFVSLIQRIQRDVLEALRLRDSTIVNAHFEAFPQKRVWVDSTLSDIQEVLNEIGSYVENVRVSGDEGGTVKLKHKFEWVLSHHQKLISRQLALNTCHQSLMAAVQAMQNVEFSGTGALGELEGLVPTPWIDRISRSPSIEIEEDEVLRGPYSRQKWRLSHRNASVPSITVSDIEQSKNQGTYPGVQPSNTLTSKPDVEEPPPVELPGSTPEDMPDPDNWDLYNVPQKASRSDIQVDFLPALPEKRAQSFELPGWVPKSISTPTLARRFRPKTVEVKKQHRPSKPVKHSSLPARIPTLHHPPSLFAELSHFVMSGYDDTEATDAETSTLASASTVSHTESPRARSNTEPAYTTHTFPETAASSAVDTSSSVSLRSFHHDNPLAIPEEPRIESPSICVPKNNTSSHNISNDAQSSDAPGDDKVPNNHQERKTEDPDRMGSPTEVQTAFAVRRKAFLKMHTREESESTASLATVPGVFTTSSVEAIPLLAPSEGNVLHSEHDPMAHPDRSESHSVASASAVSLPLPHPDSDQLGHTLSHNAVTERLPSRPSTPPMLLDESVPSSPAKECYQGPVLEGEPHPLPPDAVPVRSPSSMQRHMTPPAPWSPSSLHGQTRATAQVHAPATDPALYEKQVHVPLSPPVNHMRQDLIPSDEQKIISTPLGVPPAVPPKIPHPAATSAVSSPNPIDAKSAPSIPPKLPVAMGDEDAPPKIETRRIEQKTLLTTELEAQRPGGTQAKRRRAHARRMMAAYGDD